MARDLTTGSIPLHIWKLAIPSVLSLLGITVNNFIDGVWVGKLGPEALAAIAPSAFVIWLIFSLMDIVPVGLVAVISRYYGEKSMAKASETSVKMLQFTVMASILFMFIGLFVSRYILGFVGVSPVVVRLGNIYLQILACGLPGFFLTEALFGVFRAVGDTAIPMKATIISVVANMILDPLLIFGIGPFPKMGIGGAALATILAHYLSLGWVIYMVYRGKLPFKVFVPRILPFDFKLIWKVINIGIPISISGIVFSAVYLMLSHIGAPYGDFVVASFRVGQLCESVSFMFCFGFGQAVASMVGQNLGAQLPQRARQSAWVTVGIVSAFTLGFTLLFSLLAKPITSAFTNDIPTSTAAVYYLRIIAISQLFVGFEIIGESVFSGAGNTVPPMVVSIVGTLIRVPIALLLVGPLGVGYPGLYWAITISTIIKGTWITLWFRLGRWEFRKI
jgi:putative MATE family efflux protein